ncbi:MAG: ThiF family adenylyltransferase [Candidatus Liptonbacteria bacterium]|nr:ThiF family adenylyltransferase [Candidatus Liptonbacteria bacterium]
MKFCPGLKVIECYDLPDRTEENAVYHLLAKNTDEAYYRERTDRNIGWITQEEQGMLRKKVIGIAGCGGMGGLLGQILARLGVGEIRICDTEVFDESNINRQFGATRNTVGLSKALITARKIRETTDDNHLVVYPQGVIPATVDDFLGGCDLVCDEIEFWAIGSRILLHQRGRAHSIPIFCCNTIGFGTRLFYFTPVSTTMEECLGFSPDEAMRLQEKFQSGSASKKEIVRIKDGVVRGLFPELPKYRADGKDLEKIHGRKLREGKSPIVSTNPPMATGFLADRILLHLLDKNSTIGRNITKMPEMPGYLYFDAAKMEAKVVEGKWW